LLFIISVIVFSITIPFIYFILLFGPFFLAGIVYAQIYKMHTDNSFKIYAADLSGGALGSVVLLGFINVVGTPNSILFLTLIVFGVALGFSYGWIGKKKIITG